MNSPQWYRDEAFRQSVIRKALLLGFSCEEYNVAPYHEDDRRVEHHTYYRFPFEGAYRVGYASIYSAAFDFLRLCKLEHLAGDYRG